MTSLRGLLAPFSTISKFLKRISLFLEFQVSKNVTIFDVKLCFWPLAYFTSLVVWNTKTLHQMQFSNTTFCLATSAKPTWVSQQFSQLDCIRTCQIFSPQTVDHLLILGCISHLDTLRNYFISFHPPFHNPETIPWKWNDVTRKNLEENVTCQKVPRLRTFPSPAAPALWCPRSRDLFLPRCSGGIGWWCVLGMCSEKLQIPRGSIIAWGFSALVTQEAGPTCNPPSSNKRLQEVHQFLRRLQRPIQLIRKYGFLSPGIHIKLSSKLFQ